MKEFDNIDKVMTKHTTDSL